MAAHEPTKRPAILVVEDESGIRGALAMLLELEGFEVVAVPDALQALARLPSMRCDLIITDQMMPHMDGLTFLARVRAEEHAERIPAILISAVHRAPEGLAPLADAFVGKPFEANRLLQTIRSLLR